MTAEAEAGGPIHRVALPADAGPVRRAALVVNPAAGGGRAFRLARRLEAELVACGVTVDRRVTTGPGEATALAGEALAEGMDAVVACGGDGTVHEVVQALAGTPGRLAVAPGGRANDLAGALHIPTDPARLARMVVAGYTRRLDVGTAGPRRFTTVATLGFDSAVSARAERGIWLRGRVAYIAAVVLTLPRFRPPEVEIRGAGHVFRGRILLAATANTPMYGGGLMIAPGAQPDDGLFRVCLIHDVTRRTVLRLLPLVNSGRHTRLPAVQMWDTPFLDVRSDLPCVLYADGERLGTTPIRLEVLPLALRVIVPAPPDVPL
jgi:diacylglycerol kinase (ATP)